jgi:hypothetical protein
VLKFLLDEHISPDVADGLRRRNRTIIVRYMVEWENGDFLGQEDSTCLQEAATQGLTLVTYDRRTIPPLLKISGIGPIGSPSCGVDAEYKTDSRYGSCLVRLLY